MRDRNGVAGDRPRGRQLKNQIVLELGSASGVHLRVMAVLKRNGLKVSDLAMEEGKSGNKRLKLEVGSDAEVDLGTVYGELLQVEGVDEVTRFGRDTPSETEKPVERREAPPLSEAEKRFKNPDSEAGDEEIRDRMLIFSLLSRYPKISGRLVELKGIIPDEEHQTRFRQIGFGFGRHLVGNLKVQGAIAGHDDLFDRLLIPAIDPLARVVRIGDVIRVDLYRKEFDRGRPSALHCTFLHGALHGLLKGAETSPGFEVRKMSCVHHQHAKCEYRFLPG